MRQPGFNSCELRSGSTPHVRSLVVGGDGAVSSPESSKQLVSNGAQGAVRWRRDGRELLYLSSDGKMMSVDVSLRAALRLQPPRPLFTMPSEYLSNLAIQPNGVMDMAPDRSRFLIAMPPREEPRTVLEVILNWSEELK
jgi:hypothetical protein